MQPEPSPPVTFSGFAEPAPYLYEFWTSEGQHVYLHDMECVSIQFAPMSRQLDLTFERIESELTDHPLAHVEFPRGEGLPVARRCNR